MRCSKVGGTGDAEASIWMITRARFVLFPRGRKKFFLSADGIIPARPEYSMPKGRDVRVSKPPTPQKKSTMNDHILHDHSNDGVDRRGFLKCMAWAGTGVLWTINSGILTSRALGQTMAGGAKTLAAPAGTLNFVQISDSHIGFKKPANMDVAATFRETIARINALPVAPEFMLHTGDLTHLAEAEEFDGLEQMLKDCRTRQVFYVPGEHDILNDNGAT